MRNNKQNNTILALSLPLAILLIFASSIGLFTPNFYSQETANWMAQSIGQDMIDLFLVAPFLVIISVLASKRNKIALLLWGGANLYLVYTFVVYCFDVPFNRLFLVYCFILGLSFYSFLCFVFWKINEPLPEHVYGKAPVKTVAIYFLVIPVVFSFLWLSEIIPSIIANQPPKSLAETGLYTNPIEVIDLAIFLPGIFMTGIFLLKRKMLGLLFLPVMLVFIVLMDITIASLVVVMKQKGIEANYTVTIVMIALALFSLVMLIWYLKTMTASKETQVRENNYWVA